MRVRTGGIAAAALLIALVLLPACLPVRETSAPSRPAAEPRLDALFPLDARGEAVVTGRLTAFTRVPGSETRGAVVVTWPAYVDGALSDVSVQAEAGAATVAPGAGADPLAAADDLAARGARVRVVLRKEGTRLLVARVEPVAGEARPAGIPSAAGILRLGEGGEGRFRGPVAVTGAGAARGTLGIVHERAVYGVTVTVRVPVAWDTSTVLVGRDGTRRPLAEALRGSSDAVSGGAVEVRYRRRPDGLAAEEVRL